MNKQVKRAALAVATSMVLAASGVGAAVAAPIVTPELFRSWGGTVSCGANQRVRAQGGWSGGNLFPTTLSAPGIASNVYSRYPGSGYVISPNASSGSWGVSGNNATWGDGNCVVR